MKIQKNHFSDRSELYARYRPTYPPELYSFLISNVDRREQAWDCGTGNGQVARELSKYFDKVYATDISEQQLKNAVQKENIFYSVEPAENTSFTDNSFDMVTAAQAIHWFDFDAFYSEVKRTIRPNGVLAIIGYGLIRVDAETDELINHFYYHIIGPYWDKERKYIDENYQTIPFPFKEIDAPIFINNFEWTLKELLGYFETWSAVQHYKKANDQNPVKQVEKKLRKIWAPGLAKKVQFPILLRVARVEKKSNVE